jgi:cytochrome oxidase Cu insertion factor (SCO1/SenC/PrrC family)
MSTRPLTLSWTLIAVLSSVTSGAPQSNLAARTRVDVSKLGPQVGQRVPDFNLKDQDGKSWTLQSIMGPKGAVLVFFRSADW